jgi:hypothetical protein
MSATRSFQLTVSSINDPPTIAALPAATVPLNILTALQPVAIADVDTAASSLVVTGTSSDTNVLPNANIIIGTLGVTRTLSVHPLQTGTATVTVRVSDGLAQNSQSFLLTVTNVMTPNIPPTLNGLANVTISEDAGTQTVLVTGISSGGENQTLTVTASATPQSLISSIETVYTSPRTTGTVSFVTAPNAWGTGTVNVTVSDGLAQTARSFTVTVTPANDAPTLTSIANSTTVEDTATAPIAFTVGDAETTAASLTLSGTSSDQTLVPNANIVFGGSGASRTVRVTPAANQFGTTSISVSVSDGSLSAMRTFQLTVTSSNDPPTVATIANATTVEDTATPPISFTIGDVETAATGLTVSGTSSSLTIVPNGNIVFGGSGANRTVRVTPAANQFGTASINVLVSDGAASSIRTFQVTVMSSNDPPTMATLLPATALPGTLTALQPVVIADIDTAASSLVVTGTSSDTNVLPNANILLGTLGLSRTLSVRPVQTGAATVTLRVSDGFAQSTQSFLLTVTNATGQFALSPSLNVTNGGFRITWDSRIGYMYRVLTKTSLTQTTWIPLSNIRATNTTTSWTDFAGGQQAMGVYKIEMSAPIGFEN